MYFLSLNVSCAALVCILEDSLEDEVRLVRVLVSSLVLWTVPTYASSYELEEITGGLLINLYLLYLTISSNSRNYS